MVELAPAATEEHGAWMRSARRSSPHGEAGHDNNHGDAVADGPCARIYEVPAEAPGVHAMEAAGARAMEVLSVAEGRRRP
jgi:hypothetical protein